MVKLGMGGMVGRLGAVVVEVRVVGLETTVGGC